MTILQALTWGTEQLKVHTDTDAETKTRLDSPNLDAQVLLASCLEMPKVWIFSHFDAEVSPPREERFRSLIARRLRHEPVAYLVGSKEFCGRKFFVNPSVLIPRPATETLVEAAISEAKTSSPDRVLFADIGTGSGAIAVSLAAKTGLPVMAVDISPSALQIAQKNAETHQVTDRVDFREGSLIEPLVRMFEKIKTGGRRSPIHHLVICANLPYLTEHQWETIQPEIREYEPKLALVSGPDGLDAYWEFSRNLCRNRRTLPHRVTVLCEIDPSQTERMRSLICHDFPQASPHILKDLDGFDRVVITEI
jgi:release factor glutamine methyltransferase